MVALMAEVTRGDVVESSHLGTVVVVDGNGAVVAWAGDCGTRGYFRSSAKPFQAVPLVTSGAADAFGFTSEELALACASHSATRRHQAVVAAMLRKAGLSECDLRCGFAPPLDKDEQARVTLGLEQPSLIQCECSGKHAGMLATCQHQGWPTEHYLDQDHPLQREIRTIMAAACGVPAEALAVATDGCGLPTYGAPLRSFAAAYAVLADPDGARVDLSPLHRDALHRLRAAMTEHPELVSGEGEIDTTIMRATGGKVVAKLGAEGLLCLAIPDQRLGVAISDCSGSERGLGPGAAAVLKELDLIEEDTLSSLTQALCPLVRSFAGEPVGEVRPVLALEHA
jgi:L-asparaginase II